jgi:hypothetical protein
VSGRRRLQWPSTGLRLIADLSSFASKI